METPRGLHPSDRVLRAYGLGKVDDPTAESVNEHLESCPACRARVARLTSDSFLGRLLGAQGRPESLAPLVSSTDGLSMLVTGSDASAPPPASTLPPGLAEHADYEIRRELGRGGMGVVYLAQNKLLGRAEVLKVVSSHLVNRRGVLDRFLAEIRNAAKLDHPNVVTAYSALRLGESLVLAMQYVEGLDLARIVSTRGPLPVAHACHYAHQAALGLQHAHEHGMVHRDIKPSNLMLARQGSRAAIKVLDFGLAKVRSEAPADGTLTQEGQMLGTPDYIAPEQIRDARRADIRADIYSLGCTLYHLLTGGPPFHGDGPYDILQAHHSTDAKPLNLARPDVPVELAALVAKMMAKEPRRRFQEPKEVARALVPFFMKGSAALESPEVGIPRASGPGPDQPSKGVDTTPPQQITNDTGSIAQPPQTRVEDSAPKTEWKGPTDLGDARRIPDDTPAVTPTRRSPGLWPSVAVGMSLLGFVIGWGTAALRVKTPNGVIVVENVPEGARVELDGDLVTVTWKQGGPVKIDARPGKHVVVVRQGDVVLLGEGVLVESGGQSKLRIPGGPSRPSIRPEPLATDPRPTKDVTESPASPVGPPVRITTTEPPNMTGKSDPKSGSIVTDPRGTRHSTNPVAEEPVGPPGRKPSEMPTMRAVAAAGSEGDLLAPGDSGRGATWSYTTKHPGPRWTDLDFDDSQWLTGQMGFGKGEVDGVAIHTPLEFDRVTASEPDPDAVPKEDRVWLRARVDLRALTPADTLTLRACHKAGQRSPYFEVYVNGRLLYTHPAATNYYDYRLGPRQMDLFRPGQNVIAVYVSAFRDFAIDVGLKLSKQDGDARDGPFRPLFTGKDLAGWKSLPDYWHLEGGSLIGTPLARDRAPLARDGYKPKSLVSDRKYRDFELRFKACVTKGVSGAGESRVLFRAVCDGENFDAGGFACDLNPNNAAPSFPNNAELPLRLPSMLYSKDDFNEFAIRCVGKHVTTMVNGFTVIDADFPDIHNEGVIAWQFDGILRPKVVVFKDVLIRELDPRRPIDHP